MGSEEAKSAQQDAFDKASAEWVVVTQGGNPNSVYVEAEAGTGSRYAVAISKLPFAGAMREGGQQLISLLQPWQASMVFSVYPGEEIHLDYLTEKLVALQRPRAYGGDIAGIYKTVNHAAQLFHQVTQYAGLQQELTAEREAGL